MNCESFIKKFGSLCDSLCGITSITFSSHSICIISVFLINTGATENRKRLCGQADNKHKTYSLNAVKLNAIKISIEKKESKINSNSLKDP